MVYLKLSKQKKVRQLEKDLQFKPILYTEINFHYQIDHINMQTTPY